MNENEVKNPVNENKMGVQPVGSLLVKMGAPMCASMLVQALYNIIDSIFVSRIGPDAMTAISLAFPIQMLMVSFASGTAVGINAMLSKALGEKNHKQVQNAALNGVFLEFLTAVAFCLFGIFGARAYFASQTSTANVVKLGTEYLSIVTIGSFAFILEMTFERLLQSTGRTFVTMITQATGAIINIIFDPILIFGLFGFPKLDMKGAAIATVFGQVVAASMALIFNLKKNHEISLDFKGFKPNWSAIKRIYSVGLPSIIMQSINSVTTYLLNMILIGFSEVAVTALGIYFKLQSFFFMPVFGLNNAMIPIIAYNYGARKKERILGTIKYAILIAMSIMVAGLLLFNIFPGALLGLFNANEELLAIGIPALRIISYSFIGAGFSIVLLSVYQALGNGVYSLIVSLLRQIIVLVPVAYLLSKVAGLSGVWWAYPIAELISVLVNIVLFRKIYKVKISTL